MESVQQKEIQVAAAVSQMMSLIQNELAFNHSTLMGKYSYRDAPEGQGDEASFPGERGAIEFDDYGGNASYNSSNLPGLDGEDVADAEYVPYSMRPETYIIPIVFAIIFIIGVIGNGTLISIFLKHRSMRNVPNMYICSLAVGDILVVFFCVPFTSTVYTVESWPYGVVVCKFSEFIKDLSIGVSVFTLTALSADRYFAIVDPMRKLTGRRATRITCITIVGIWFVSILFALPSLIFSFVWTVPVEGTNKTFDVCYPFPKELTDAFAYPKVVVMFKFLVYYAIPLCFIATFYIIMAHSLLQSTRNIVGENQGQQGKQIQSRKKVAKMVLSFVVIFAICFFPSHVFLIWFYYYPDAEEHYNYFWHLVRIFGFCLSFMNSCLNPISLYLVSGTFRKHFNRHLFCCCCKDTTRPLLRNNRGIGGGVMMNHHVYAANRIVHAANDINGAVNISRKTKYAHQHGINGVTGIEKNGNEIEMTSRKKGMLGSLPEEKHSELMKSNSKEKRKAGEGAISGVTMRRTLMEDGGSNGNLVTRNHHVSSCM